MDVEKMNHAGTSNSNNTNSQVWQQHSHPIELTTPEIASQKLEYLHNNPVKAGFVRQPEDYLYSSAIDYYINERGLLPITVIDLGLVH